MFIVHDAPKKIFVILLLPLMEEFRLQSNKNPTHYHHHRKRNARKRNTSKKDKPVNDKNG